MRKYQMIKNLNSIPLTDEEKKNVLTTAMGTWIDGMMEATDGYVCLLYTSRCV